MFYCSKCGSENHQEMDCASPNPKGTFAPPVPELTELQKFQAADAMEAAEKKRAQPETKLDPPRWPGGPPVCAKENLLAFADESAMGKFMDSIASHGAQKKWLCEWCSCWHYVPLPLTDSNGYPRAALPKNFRPFLRESTRQMTGRREREDELPQQRREPAAAKKSVDKPRAAAATSAQRKRNADELI